MGCPICGHAWEQHSVEDGKCEAGAPAIGWIINMGVCPCGRSIKYQRDRNAELSAKSQERP